MGRPSIWPEQSEEPRAAGDASVWGSHTSRGLHDFSLFSAGDVGVSHKISQGKCKSQICSQGRCLYLAEGHNIFSTNHKEVQRPSPSFVWPGREGKVCCTGTCKCHKAKCPVLLHISHTDLKCVHQLWYRIAVSPVLSFMSHLYQKTVPELLPFPPELTISTLFPAITAKCSQWKWFDSTLRRNRNASSTPSNRRKLQHANCFNTAAHTFLFDMSRLPQETYSSFFKIFASTPCLKYTPHPSWTPACNPNCCHLNSDKCATVKHKKLHRELQNSTLELITFIFAYMLLILLLEYYSCSHSTSTLKQTKYTEHIKPSW